MNQNWHNIFPKSHCLELAMYSTLKHSLSTIKINYNSKIKISLICALINPLSANGDQHQFSPNDIRTLSRDYVMRINKTII